MFHFVQDGGDHWETLGPKDVIPGDNIFGTASLDESTAWLVAEEYDKSCCICVGSGSCEDRLR